MQRTYPYTPCNPVPHAAGTAEPPPRMKTGAGRAKQLPWQPVDRGARRACSTAPLPSASAAPLAGTALAARDDKRPHQKVR